MHPAVETRAISLSWATMAYYSDPKILKKSSPVKLIYIFPLSAKWTNIYLVNNVGAWGEMWNFTDRQTEDGPNVIRKARSLDLSAQV